MRKQFIAGVRCPECQQLDKIYVYRNDEGDDVAQCNACGYVSIRPKTITPEPMGQDEGVVRIVPGKKPESQ